MLEERRLVLYKNRIDYVHPKPSNQMDPSSNASCFQQTQITSNDKPLRTKSRRPDMQLYIPRAKRKSDAEVAAEAIIQTAPVDIKVKSQKKDLREKKNLKSLDVKTNVVEPIVESIAIEDEPLVIVNTTEQIVSTESVEIENELEFASDQIETKLEFTSDQIENKIEFASDQIEEIRDSSQCDMHLPLSPEIEIRIESDESYKEEIERQTNTTKCELINAEHFADLSLPSESELSPVMSNATISDNTYEEVTKDSEESSWEAMYNEDGECLAPDLVQDITDNLGEVTIEKAKIDYTKFHAKIIKEHEFDHIIEIYDFPAEFKTADLISAFSAFRVRGFDVKWVDETHALGLFASPIAAAEALSMRHTMVKTRSLSEGSRESQLKARRIGSELQPYKPRPETSATLARRLVTGALGLNSLIPREQRAKERQQLKDAKAKKKLTAKQKKDVWDGTVN